MLDDFDDELESFARYFHYVKFMSIEGRGVGTLKYFSPGQLLLILARLAVLSKIVNIILKLIARYCWPKSRYYNHVMEITSHNAFDVEYLASLEECALIKILEKLKLHEEKPRLDRIQMVRKI